MRNNNQEQNGEVKEEMQGVDEEETYMAQNLTFGPLFMDGDAHNHPNPSMNMEDDFLNNLWADGPAHTLTNAIGPPASVAAENGGVNEEFAANEMGLDNSETLEDFLQKAGVLPPGPTSNGPTIRPYGPPQVPLLRADGIPPWPTSNGPTIPPYGPPQAPLQLPGTTSNGPTIRPYGPPQVPLLRAGAPPSGPAFQPYHPPPTPRLNLEPPSVEMAVARGGQINNRPTLNGPTVQPPYGPSRVPCTGLQNAQMAGHGPLPEARNLNSAGVGYGGQTIAAGNTSSIGYPYNGSIGVGFGGFTCDPPEVAGVRVGSSVVAAGPTEGMGGSGDRGKRLVYELEEVVAERRTRRKVKNRESAARSRARKQAYVITMEAERDRLQGENSRLRLREQRLLKEKPEEAGPSTVRRCKSCSW
ncbi:transcription factor HBP-1a-like [Ananas comosus]|uniref:Transcription factor HBP-1a-like n=1 Tax=Ananas comosus TaxID=4615 RepID=A0A6P5F4L7_ANACO|nr:transcription factor HBP-1a-like [Ananas comosus]